MRRHENKAGFQIALDVLSDETRPISAEAIVGLSGLNGTQMAALRTVWARMSAARRRKLTEALVEAGENDFMFDFDPVLVLALDDQDSQVRATAVEGVIGGETPTVIEKVRRLAEGDPAAEVRANAVSRLGEYILLGEYEEVPERISRQLQETALALYRSASEPLEVRRRALEAIANCDRDEVEGMIREAYRSPDLLMRVSAVCAMGRTCDEAWAPEVLAELDSEHPELRYEAANAAGELELVRAVPYLAEMARGEDREIQLAAVWSLGEIGGEHVESILDDLATQAEANGDFDLLEAIEDAEGAAALDMWGDADKEVLHGALQKMMPLFDFGGHDHDMHDDDEFDGEFDDEDEDEDLIEDVDEEFDNDFGELPGFRVFSAEDEADELLDEDFDEDDFAEFDDDDKTL